ncbi:hypothetical protein J27TS8_24020 [Robertmurraya siralis]|uniref:Uncharacterized protein n=1 Tax=Robertmurraya siralis TaxID=77777 RepID=A0A919WIK3_9BACI|nr:MULTISPECIES: hypothetical protein [Robertmurraya]MDF1509656.1 hypothetical protein [Robertmurraya sp. DFI.2.37]GIN62409.1 hypothetical protein J27TS8_24020 [Robertmurraya siralis]
MKSQCCQADVMKRSKIDAFHGADDEYELQIPVIICRKCGREEQLIFSGQKVKTNHKAS